VIGQQDAARSVVVWVDRVVVITVVADDSRALCRIEGLGAMANVETTVVIGVTVTGAVVLAETMVIGVVLGSAAQWVLVPIIPIVGQEARVVRVVSVNAHRTVAGKCRWHGIAVFGDVMWNNNL
jgi:hypothetical protein